MSAPIGNTCPDINSIIASVKEAYDYLITAADTLDTVENKENITGIEEAMNILEPLFSRYNNPLEELREANARLREYGEKQEDLLNDCTYELSQANDRILELENSINELEKSQ